MADPSPVPSCDLGVHVFLVAVVETEVSFG